MKTVEDIKRGALENSNIIKGEEYRNYIIAASDIGVDVVSKTLGPGGKTTVISDGANFIYPTKDGFNTLKSIVTSDPLVSYLYNVLKKVSFDLANSVGDATTSAWIGANQFTKYIIEYLDNNSIRQADFLKALHMVVDKLEEAISTSDQIIQIDKSGDFSDIYKIAYIASNGNEKISGIIQKIYQETRNSFIRVTFDGMGDIDYEIQKGYRFNGTLMSFNRYINTDDKRVVYNDEKVDYYIFDHNMTYIKHNKIVTAILTKSIQTNRKVVILAPYYDDVLANTLAGIIDDTVQQRRRPTVHVVQYGLSGDISRQAVKDLITIVNAQCISIGKVSLFNAFENQKKSTDVNEVREIEEEISTLQEALGDNGIGSEVEAVQKKVGYTNFTDGDDILNKSKGHSNTVEFDQSYILIKDYESIYNKVDFDANVQEAEDEYLKAKDTAIKSKKILDQALLNTSSRYFALKSNVGTIKIGAQSESEKMFLKDVIEDVVMASSSAFEHGYVRGLNLAILTEIEELDITGFTELEKDICGILYNVFSELSITVMKNCYKDVDEMKQCEALSEFNSFDNVIDYCVSEEKCFNLVTEKFENKGEYTVINSAKTDISILKAMTDILSTILTSDQLLATNIVFDKEVTRKEIMENKAETAEMIADAVMKTIKTHIDDIVIEEKNEKSPKKIIKKVISIFKK